MTDAQMDASTIAKMRETLGLHAVARNKNPILRSFSQVFYSYWKADEVLHKVA